MTTTEDQDLLTIRNAFEAKCSFMRVEWSMEWDSAGFYSDIKADAAFTWFQIGYTCAQAVSNPH